MKTAKSRGNTPIKFTMSSISNKKMKHMSGAPKCDSYSEEYSVQMIMIIYINRRQGLPMDDIKLKEI